MIPKLEECIYGVATNFFSVCVVFILTVVYFKKY